MLGCVPAPNLPRNAESESEQAVRDLFMSGKPNKLAREYREIMVTLTHVDLTVAGSTTLTPSAASTR